MYKMSKDRITRCPKCGSYNIGTAYLNYVGRGAINVFRGTISLAGGLAAEIIRPHSPLGHKVAEEIWKETDPGPMNKHVCYKCGHKW